MESSKMPSQRDFQRINLADLAGVTKHYDFMELSLSFLRRKAGQLHDWVLPSESQEPIILVFPDTAETH